jgi:hypothetical protein
MPMNAAFMVLAAAAAAAIGAMIFQFTTINKIIES